MLKYFTVQTPNVGMEKRPSSSSTKEPPTKKRDQSPPSSSTKEPPKKKAKHKKVKHREHVLLRPDTYVGQTEQQTQQMWVITRNGNPEEREVVYSAAMLKIFDELIQNIEILNRRYRGRTTTLKMRM